MLCYIISYYIILCYVILVCHVWGLGSLHRRRARLHVRARRPRRPGRRLRGRPGRQAPVIITTTTTTTIIVIVIKFSTITITITITFTFTTTTTTTLLLLLIIIRSARHAEQALRAELEDRNSELEATRQELQYKV